MVCTVKAFVLMLCCGVALWAMFSISPCANIKLPVLQRILDYTKNRIIKFLTWYMFSSILSLFRNVPESQYSECELTCGQRLFWILKRTTLKMHFWNQKCFEATKVYKSVYLYRYRKIQVTSRFHSEVSHTVLRQQMKWNFLLAVSPTCVNISKTACLTPVKLLMVVT